MDSLTQYGERGGSVVECRTPEREVGGSKPTAAMLCPWARHFTPRKYWLITQEAVAPSRHDWKIVDWDVKPQHKHKTISTSLFNPLSSICISLHQKQTNTWNIKFYLSMYFSKIVEAGWFLFFRYALISNFLHL